jgi:hypothetical protein
VALMVCLLDYDDLHADDELAEEIVQTGKLPQLPWRRGWPAPRPSTAPQPLVRRGGDGLRSSEDPSRIRDATERRRGRDEYTWNGFDDALQVWVVEGVVHPCGHPPAVSGFAPCCAAFTRAGQRIEAFPGAQPRHLN